MESGHETSYELASSPGPPERGQRPASPNSSTLYLYTHPLQTWCLNARSSDDVSARTEKDVESRHKSRE